MEKQAPLTAKDVTGIILAGGRSSRMGQNKAFLTVKDQERMIDATVTLFNKLFSETIIVSNEPECYEYLDAQVISDIIPRKGPMSGMHAGLTVAKHDYSFIVPCDMPFLNADLIQMLIGEAPGYDLVVPQLEDYLQPLHAVYHKRCIEPIENCLRENVFKIIAFYPWVKVKFAGENKLYYICERKELERIFFNVNTKSDLEQAKIILEN